MSLPRSSAWTPLPPSADGALADLSTHVEPRESFSYEQAYAILLTDELTHAGVDDLLKTLLLRGYLYEVDGKLRITD